MAEPPLTLARVNALDHEQFTERLGALFEGPPWIVDAVWERRPFASVAQLYEALCGVMRAAPRERQVALIQAHPDLVGRAALTGTLGKASRAEQASAGLDRLAPDEVATFQRLNAEYQARFGFPFVICARENSKATILAGLAARLPHTSDAEIATALDEIAKICALRLRDTLLDEETP
jgi:OHCU decarboxylase